MLVAFGLIAALTISAQQKVTGVVKSPAGEPLTGVAVIIDGTTNGVMTDIDGKYSIELPARTGDEKTALSFSCIGLKTVIIAVGNKKVIDVVLEEDSIFLGESVVIGYGTVNRRDLTGSVASIQADKIAAVPVTNVSEALTGKLPGVNITTTEGSPDADVKIRVRGGGSLSQDNSPLYIVDGFPVTSISDIAPSEIQSIDILKDASSTAIYGAQGANGVVIVTTKSGREGKAQVNLNAAYGVKQVTRLTQVMSPYDFVAYQHELDASNFGAYEDLDIWRSRQGIDYQDELFGRIGNTQQYNVNVSGGSKAVTYNVSYAHNEEESIMLGSGYSKNNINAKIKSDITKWLTLDFNARLSHSVVDGLGSGADTNESNAANSSVANSVVFRPVSPLSENTEDDDNATRRVSPLEKLLATQKQRTQFRQNYNAALNFKIYKGLSFRTEFGYGWSTDETEQYWEPDAVTNSRYGHNGLPQAYRNAIKRTDWRNANTLTYDNKDLFGGRDHLNVLVGHEISSRTSSAYNTVSVDYPSTMSINEMKANWGAGTPLPTGSTISANENMLSFFGRVNYTLMERYLFTVTFRADASSKFAPGNQWGFFPSGAFAWRISDEPFMKSASNWLSMLKLRLSYGTAGNNRISSGLLYTTYSMSGSDSRNPYFNESSTSMLEHGTYLSNSALKWETTVSRNIGIDYGFLKGRISGAVDLYWNTTKDLLMRSEIPSNSGYSYQYQNFGQTSNKGVEVSLNAVILDKNDFYLDFNANFAFNSNRIDRLNTDSPWQSSSWAGSTISKYEDFRVVEGGSLGEVWGYRTNGYFTVYDPVSNPAGELVWNTKDKKWGLKDGYKDNSNSITGGSYFPGGLKVEVDENGNPVKQRLGNTVPDMIGGFGLNARLKGFDLSVFFNYSLGNVIINGTKLASSFYTGSKREYNLNNDYRLANRYSWIDPVTGMNLARGDMNELTAHYGSAEAVGARLNELNAGKKMYNPASASQMQLTDYAVEDASFLRLQNVTLGYSLPKRWMDKCFLGNVRIYATLYNLFCWTAYTGADPEVDTSSKRNAMTPGVDYAAYPKSRTYLVGLNITF